MIKVYIKDNEPYSKPIRYVLKTLAKSRDLDFHIISEVENANLIWDHTSDDSIPIHVAFYKILKSDHTDFSYNNWLNESCMITTSDGNVDIMGTAFFMLSCLQEHVASDSLDHFGRFLYKNSYQFRHENVQENIVQHLFDSFLNQHKIEYKKKRSKIFISHDIDTIYGSLLQDGFWALKHGRIDVIIKILLQEVIRKPGWKNFDKIMRINDAHELKSTFFWLVNKGMGLKGIKNADYDIQQQKKELERINKAGFINGLHKSASKDSLDQEKAKNSQLNPYNRYHFLQFLPRLDWPKISDSSIELDASLGFAEQFGFRNSYGNAYQPYDIYHDQPFDFVEAPLHCMDTTFHKYLKINPDQIGQLVIEFFEKNKYDCCLSLLWHNTYFTDYKYKGFLKEYKKILSYLYEEKLEYILPKEIIEESKIEW